MRVIQALGSARDGGAETYYLSLIAALQRQGVDQHAFLRPHAGRLDALAEMKVPAVTAAFSGPLDLATPLRFRRLARRFQPDVVMTWMSRASGRVPPGQYKKVGRVGGFYSLKYFRTCDHLIVLAPAIRDHMVQQGWPAEKTTVIPNLCRFVPTAPVERASLDTPEEAPVFLALSRLHPNKALDSLLKAFASVEGAYLWIAGSGPEEAKLRQLSHDLGLNDRVRFLGWRTDQAALLAACDCVVFPSRVEPFGSVTVEAWAARRPLVAAAATGPAWIIRDEEDGLLVPVDDVDRLAEAMRRLRDDPQLRSRLAEAGFARYRAGFTEEVISQKYQDVFRNISR